MRAFAVAILWMGLLATSSHAQNPTSTSAKVYVGEISDPPGYVQPSIATIRLWKKRGGN